MFSEIKEQVANGKKDDAKLQLDALIILYQNDLSVEQQLVEAMQLQQEFNKPPSK